MKKKGSKLTQKAADKAKTVAKTKKVEEKVEAAEFDDDNAEWLKPAEAEKMELLGSDDEDDASETGFGSMSGSEEESEEEDIGSDLEIEKQSKKLDRKAARDAELAEEEMRLNLEDDEDAEDFEEGYEEEAEDGEEGSGEKINVTGKDVKALKEQIESDVALLANWKESKKSERQGRNRDEVVTEVISAISQYYGYNEALAEYFFHLFKPEEAIEFFEANEKPRPLTIRTNSLKTRRKTLQQTLTTRGMQVEPIGDWTKAGLKILESTVPVGATPEYLAGHYMIQSASSFVPVMALAPQMHETVCDMAAAPGGKTTYLGQLMQNTGTIYANDLKKERTKPLAANIARMGMTNTCVINEDGLNLKKILPKLDRVLLDAPCTGAGIIARDPSIKVKRTPGDFVAQASLQKRLLSTAVDMVDAKSKTGGYIVYSTCSLAIEENEMVIDYILKNRDVQVVPFDANVAIGTPGFTSFQEKRFHPSIKHSRRFYPHQHNMDGFYVCKLKKLSDKLPERPSKDRRKCNQVTAEWGEEMWKKATNGLMTFGDDESKAGAKRKAEEAAAEAPMTKKQKKAQRQVEREEKENDPEFQKQRKAVLKAKKKARDEKRAAKKGVELKDLLKKVNKKKKFANKKKGEETKKADEAPKAEAKKVEAKKADAPKADAKKASDAPKKAKKKAPKA